MSQQEAIKQFESQKVRTYWDDEQEKWFFCINDVVSVLTDSVDVRQYIKRLRSRDLELDSVWGTICTLHQFRSTDGKKHAQNCTDLKGAFRIIQSIPSKKAEQPQSMSEHAHAAARGGEVAKVAREAFEQQTGKKVVSPLNAKDYFDSLQPHIDFEDDDQQKT